ncbi:gag-pol precursor polyprotein [Chelydra serpentina]|uniref:ribonuclease H n=1 Tax=Chelydra serpentina TaxID=8475 RepID=A0A8T1SVK9_CHESE|nr:gag-pol precursor polyprotein [Chelydra serpentina]
MVPIADPRWNPNEPQDQTRLTTYKELLLHGLRHSAVRHNNWAKPYELIQEPKESLVAFLQCIRDAIRQNTNANPDEQATEAIIKGIFTRRATPAIKRKLQKKEDLMGMTMAQILETANRAYSLREGEKEKRQVDTQSQEIFSFEWEDKRRVKKQLCWTVLAQGFKNSPTRFGQALARDLEEWDNEDKVLLLQYVDDLLIAAVGLTPCLKATVSLLNFVGCRGYRVARSKAQIALPEVQYLGFHIRQGERRLSNERKEAICQIPIPSNRKRLRAFLGMAGFCRIWIPEFGLWAKPLYECVKGADHDPFHWSSEANKAFKVLKSKLMEAPALGLPDLTKPFQLYVHERKGVALGVLTQLLGT